MFLPGFLVDTTALMRLMSLLVFLSAAYFQFVLDFEKYDKLICKSDCLLYGIKTLNIWKF